MADWYIYLVQRVEVLTLGFWSLVYSALASWLGFGDSGADAPAQPPRPY